MSGPFTPQSIATNTSEDYIDELTSGIVYKYADYAFSGFDENLIKDDDAFAEALEGAKQTLKFSIMNAVIFTVTEYALTKLVTVSGILYLWIKKRRVVNAVKNGIKNGLGNVPLVGGFLSSGVNTAVTIANGTQAENLKMAEMGNHSANNITSIMGQERQTQTMIKSKQHDNMVQTLGVSSKSKFSRDTKKLEAYNYKMKTGSWQNTTLDKNLFLSCVPREYVKQPFNFTAKFVAELNAFKEYATDSEGKLLNLAQTHVNNMTAHNISKVK